MAEEHKGGRLAANPRRGNIVEGVAAQMLRPFAAVAQVAREEDFGIDLIGTLIRREGRCLVAEDSFNIQIKTHSSAKFAFEGDGVAWLKRLRLPYFPLVLNLDIAEARLYTLNEWHRVLHTSVVDKFVFVEPEELQNDPGDEYFSLGEPLMRWTLADCAHDEFARWAYSVLKPIVRVETANQQNAPMWRFLELIGGPYRFQDRNADGVAAEPPRVGKAHEIPPGDRDAICDALRCVIGPFANLVSNMVFPDDRSGDLLTLRDSLRRLGFDPDSSNRWERIAREMAAHFEKESE